ncbi:MAG: hypothetical protein CMB32_03670 [Euryarchaeota archaeon]|nr:hypothetical protein [Euryarchaeota archaeon]
MTSDVPATEREGTALAETQSDRLGVSILNSTARLTHWDMEFQNWEKGVDQGQKRESSSGVGSTLRNTRNTVQMLVKVISARGVTSMVDLPCGDWNWMSKAITQFPHVKYTGMDLSPTLIARNAKKFPSYDFVVHDIVMDMLPKEVDLVLNRDMLFHVPPSQGLKALRNIAASGSHYLLSTTFPNSKNEKVVAEASDGGAIWYPINLNGHPFNLPPALSMYAESEGQGKSMGLWDLRDPQLRAAVGLLGDGTTGLNAQAAALHYTALKQLALFLIFAVLLALFLIFAVSRRQCRRRAVQAQIFAKARPRIFRRGRYPCL